MNLRFENLWFFKNYEFQTCKFSTQSFHYNKSRIHYRKKSLAISNPDTLQQQSLLQFTNYNILSLPPKKTQIEINHPA